MSYMFRVYLVTAPAVRAVSRGQVRPIMKRNRHVISTTVEAVGRWSVTRVHGIVFPYPPLG
jgi:hypothetical protein